MMNELDPEIEAFLTEGGYESLEAWMADSDFTFVDGEWLHEEGHVVDPVGTIEGAMEACGYV